jgi:hypothetical protein
MRERARKMYFDEGPEVGLQRVFAARVARCEKAVSPP